MRRQLACPACGAPVEPAYIQPPPDWYVCEHCRTRTPRNELVSHVSMSHFQHHPLKGGGAPVTTGGFPRTWLYFGTTGAGSPLMTTPGVFDQSYINAIAKYDLVTLDTTPFTDPSRNTNLDCIGRLKQVNPQQTIIWYDVFQQRFTYATSGTMWKDAFDLIQTPTDKNIYCLDGTHWPYNDATLWWWDVSKDNAAASLSAVWNTYTAGKADGVFFDIIGNPGTGNGSNGSPMDYARLGYASAQAVNDAVVAGTASFIDIVTASSLRSGSFYCNRGGSTAGISDVEVRKLTGELLEGWDRGQGQDSTTPPGFAFATFDDAMTLCLSWQGNSPTGNGTVLLKAEMSTAHTTAWNKVARYTLGSACIAGGLAYIGNNRDPLDAFLVADEYAVAGGGTDSTGAIGNRGWLGRPLAYGAKDATSGMYVRRFERGIVVVNGPDVTRAIDLGRPYRRIHGVYDTTVNDGTLVQNLSVPAKDARFLLNA